MIDMILIVVGGLLVGWSIVFYYLDCKGKVTATTGGEISFSIYWLFGAVPLLLGLFPLCGLSRWWTLAAILPVYLLSFPLRTAISRLVCVPFLKEPTGFQKFIRKVESKEGCRPSDKADCEQPTASRPSAHNG